MVSKSVETFPPTVDTDTMIKTEMLAAMIPYSIAVVPFSLSRKRRIQRPDLATKLRIDLSVRIVSGLCPVSRHQSRTAGGRHGAFDFNESLLDLTRNPDRGCGHFLCSRVFPQCYKP